MPLHIGQCALLVIIAIESVAARRYLAPPPPCPPDTPCYGAAERTLAFIDGKRFCSCPTAAFVLAHSRQVDNVGADERQSSEANPPPRRRQYHRGADMAVLSPEPIQQQAEGPPPLCPPDALCYGTAPRTVAFHRGRYCSCPTEAPVQAHSQQTSDVGDTRGAGERQPPRANPPRRRQRNRVAEHQDMAVLSPEPIEKQQAEGWGPHPFCSPYAPCAGARPITLVFHWGRYCTCPTWAFVQAHRQQVSGAGGRQPPSPPPRHRECNHATDQDMAVLSPEPIQQQQRPIQQQRAAYKWKWSYPLCPPDAPCAGARSRTLAFHRGYFCSCQ